MSMSRVKDLPGQLAFNGKYAKNPDEACEKCTKPMTPPVRPKAPRPTIKRRIFNLIWGDQAKAMVVGSGTVIDGEQFNEYDAETGKPIQ